MSIIDAFFNKRIGPVFLKENSDSENFIAKMKTLSERASGNLKNEIDEQIKLAEIGLLGEKQIIYELKNSGLDMYILHDIYLEKGDLSAQIDFLICTRQHIYAIECKNLFGDIEIDDKGNFIRRFNYGKFYKREGLYSPITQNERHLNVLREVRRDAKIGSFLGLAEKVFDENFSSNYKSIVVLANPKTVLNDKKAPKNIREKVIRADQLVAFIKKMDNTREADWSDSSMLETMQYFLNCNRPNKSDYARKYEDIYLMSVVGKIKEESADQTSIEHTKSSSTEKICPKCGKPLVLRTAKKGENAGNQFWGCSGFPKCWYKE
ncbi:MAG: NERD domain-containing protein [Fibrobacter sp.]|nr:NERD domain-containing protein [Fibrobacter sp.]